jgi:hypothetical protein
LSELEVGTYEEKLLPLKQLTGNRIRKIEGIVAEFNKTKAKPAEEIPGLLDKEKDAKVADLLKPLDPQHRIPMAPAEVVVGIPADLLRRRPDVRRVERQVAAQSARIGVAQSDFYPHFAINGTIGVSAEQFGRLFHGSSSMIGDIGPSFRWDILNYGRILNNVRVQDARFQELAFHYQNTVLRAGTEAEDSIVGFLNAQEQTDRLAASSDAAARTLEISYDQYRLGAIDFTPVVLFESTLAQQQDQLATSQGSIALNLIAIYRALGGGWEMRLTRDGGAACLAGMTPASAGPVPPTQRSAQDGSLPQPQENQAPARTDSTQFSRVSTQEQTGTQRAAMGTWVPAQVP